MPKRDMDCLLFHLLRKHALIGDGANRTIAAALGINETKVKSYLTDSHYKYEDDAIEHNVMQIVTGLCCGTIKPVFEDSSYSFIIENPVVKGDFETRLKQMGLFADTSFNKEVVKIKDSVLHGVILGLAAPVFITSKKQRSIHRGNGLRVNGMLDEMPACRSWKP
jgi:hypothetical protein